MFIFSYFRISRCVRRVMLTNHIYISQDSWVYTHLARVVTLHTSFGLVVTPTNTYILMPTILECNDYDNRYMQIHAAEKVNMASLSSILVGTP